MRFVPVDNYLIWNKLLKQKVILPIETFELGEPEKFFFSRSGMRLCGMREFKTPKNHVPFSDYETVKAQWSFDVFSGMSEVSFVLYDGFLTCWAWRR